MLFKLEKPDLSKIDHKQIFELLIGNNKTEIFDFIKRTSSKYLYWDKIRYEKPSPKEISKKELWMIIKIFRESQAIKTGEPVFVTDESKGLVYYEAPDIDFVKDELIKLIKFANDESTAGVFIHPIIKAIMLYFWLGYLHPFSDGNGRLARLLFYWYLVKEGYWAFVYLPISKIIKRSPKQYIMAYVYSEQDDNDLTYFVNYNFKKN